jgi:hypothetical protein
VRHCTDGCSGQRRSSSGRGTWAWLFRCPNSESGGSLLARSRMARRVVAGVLRIRRASSASKSMPRPATRPVPLLSRSDARTQVTSPPGARFSLSARIDRVSGRSGQTSRGAERSESPRYCVCVSPRASPVADPCASSNSSLVMTCVLSHLDGLNNRSAGSSLVRDLEHESWPQTRTQPRHGASPRLRPGAAGSHPCIFGTPGVRGVACRLADLIVEVISFAGSPAVCAAGASAASTSAGAIPASTSRQAAQKRPLFRSPSPSLLTHFANRFGSGQASTSGMGTARGCRGARNSRRAVASTGFESAADSWSRL